MVKFKVTLLDGLKIMGGSLIEGKHMWIISLLMKM